MYEPELKLAKRAAKNAGAFLCKKENVYVDAAEGKDIKLSSDKNSERIIIDILKDTNVPILSEECGCVGRNKSEYLWIIDPLDGTANYWKGIEELACVSVALWKKNKPILGVVYRFAVDELFYGIVGQGAYLNGKPIYTSDIKKIGKAVIATGFPVHRNYGTDSLSEFIGQVQRFKKVRMLGSAAIMGALVAVGKFDAYMEEEIMLWDIAGATAIVQAAGGAVSVQLLNEYKCICKCFANQELMEDYHA